MLRKTATSGRATEIMRKQIVRGWSWTGSGRDSTEFPFRIVRISDYCYVDIWTLLFHRLSLNISKQLINLLRV